MIATWIGTDDVAYALFVLDDVGFGGVVGVDRAIEWIESDSGDTVARERTPRRTVTAVHEVMGDDQADLADRVGQFVASLGEGRLEVELAGRTRVLPCRYDGGLPATIGRDLSAARQKLAVRWAAGQPWWLDFADTVTVVQRGDMGTWLPWPPISTLADGVAATIELNNGGHSVAWPTWVVTGPADTVTLTNATSGLVIDLADGIGAGAELTIDTAPGIKTVTDSAGTNRFADLTGVSRLWPLVRGLQDIEVRFTGDGPDTSVELSWRRRWATP